LLLVEVFDLLGDLDGGPDFFNLSGLGESSDFRRTDAGGGDDEAFDMVLPGNEAWVSSY